MKTLDLLSFPLDQHALIEASAGTGKTYALANLYLRYVIERRLDVSEILVVTFTEAATQELKDRIRSRIKALIRVFEGEQTDDPILRALHSGSNDNARDKVLLKLAERSMDTAEIYTIHGFCQQVLSKHALELGLPLEQSLLEDETAAVLSVLQDIWRTEVFALPDFAQTELCSLWAGPDGLLNDVLPVMRRMPEHIIPQACQKGISQWAEVVVEHYAWFRRIQRRIAQDYDEVMSLLAASDLKRKNDKLKWWASVGEWLELEQPSELPACNSRKNVLKDFLPEQLMAQTTAKGKAPEHALFVWLEEALSTPPVPIKESFLSTVISATEQALTKKKHDEALVSFDDLIAHLANVITCEKRGPMLVSRLSSRFSIALIDEFQDTDKLQYQIFSRIFLEGSAKNAEASSTLAPRLVLIGDPKQAIYGFRGGDISTYLNAKQAIQSHPSGELFTLGTNWRSSAAMVEAVNHVFQQKDRPFLADEIPFYPVNAASSETNSVLSGAALQIACLNEESQNKAHLQSALSQYCVAQILTLLKKPDVKYEDIAILVRSGQEAELIQRSLLSVGLSASYEGKSSVFDSEEADALLLLLKAAAKPNDEYSVRACLASMFFGMSDEMLKECQQNEVMMARLFERFEGFHQTWLKHGVLAMIRESLHEFDIYRHWRQRSERATVSSERHLSNLNQLAELLQKRSRIERSIPSLVEWFEKEVSDVSSLSEDERKIRLESDEQLIRIVTIHKSKGLEYAYVFLPFIFGARQASEYYFYDEEKNVTLDLTKHESNMHAVEQERLAEDIRLFYVALTRAKYACYIGTAFYKGGRMSLGTKATAFAQLLGSSEAGVKYSLSDWIECLRKFSDKSDGRVSLTIIDQDMLLNHRPLEQTTPLSEHGGNLQSSSGESNTEPFLSPRVFTRAFDYSYKTQSFTGLIHEHHRHKLGTYLQDSEPENQEITEIEMDTAPDTLALDTGHSACSLSIMDFPKGSDAGTFLHTLFEKLSLSTGLPLSYRRSPVSGAHGQADDSSIDAEEKRAILKEFIVFHLKSSQLIESNMESWAEFLCDWVTSVLEQPLCQGGVMLSSLSEKEYHPELEFYLSVDQIDQGALNHLLTSYGYESISFDAFNGFLKGAIDLVFRSNNQYFILDYKSNYLGDDVGQYTQQNMKVAMQEHRYDIQYLIYTLAFHRYLQGRLGRQYNYDKDFAGVLYVFLRGLNKHSDNGVYFKKPEGDLIKALDELVRTNAA